MSLLTRLGGATTRLDEFGRWVNTQVTERGERVIHAGMTETGAWIFEATPELPADVLPIEVIAAQPHYGEDFDEAEETQDYAAPPEQLEFLAPPEVRVPELIAAQSQPEVEWTQAELEDYGSDSTLDITPQLFQQVAAAAVEVFAAQPLLGDQFETYVPEETQDYQADSTLETLPVCDFNIYSDIYGDCVPVLTDAMLVAAQPSFADDLATYVPEETQDYVGAPEQLEFLAPPEIRIPELIPTIELREQAWFPDAETEDYGPDSTVEVPQLYPATAAEPVESFASQPLAEQWYFPADEIEDYLALPEQVEFLAPPEVPSAELVAAQPHYGEAFWPEAETEDYQQDASLDVTATFFPLPLEVIEVFAAQPHYGEWFWEAEETQDYVGAPDQVEVLAPADTETVLASQPELGTYFWPDPETEDYQNESALDVSALTQPPVAEIVELIASSYSAWFEWVEPETLEDYQLTTTIDISAQLFPPPLNPGLPVEDPQAGDLLPSGHAVLTGTQGEAVLVGDSGHSILTPVNG